MDSFIQSPIITDSVNIQNVSGTEVNPATQDTLALIKAKTDRIGQYYDFETSLWTDTTGADGSPHVMRYETAIALGHIPGHTSFRGWGQRTSLSSAVTGDDLWEGTATTQPIPNQTTGDLMTVVSTSAQDGVAGTGVLTLDIHYLDATGAIQETIVTMNGTTPVDIPAIYMRYIQSIHTETIGTNGTAVGTITIYKTGSPTIVYNQLNPGGNMSLNSSRMIPLGKTFYMTNLSITGASGKAISIRLRATSTFEDILTTGNFFLFKDVTFLQDSTREKTFLVPLKFPALSIVKATVYSTTAGGSASVNYDGWTE